MWRWRLLMTMISGDLWTSTQVLEAQMKADMADKEMLESSQSKYEEEVREKCSVISEQKAVRCLFPAGEEAAGPPGPAGDPPSLFLSLDH